MDVDTIDYYDYEESIKAFWFCSLKKDFNKFDFNDALEPIQECIKRKLTEHGLTTFEDYKENEEELYCFDNLKEYTQITDYIQITEEDLKECILKYKFERNKERFEDYDSFKTLAKLSVRIDCINSMSLQEKIQLFDECIHAEHETDQLLDIKDIDELRTEFDKDYVEVIKE